MIKGAASHEVQISPEFIAVCTKGTAERIDISIAERPYHTSSLVCKVLATGCFGGGFAHSSPLSSFP